MPPLTVEEMVADRLTVPEEPLVPTMVMLKRATDPALIVAVKGLAETLKLGTVNATMTE